MWTKQRLLENGMSRRDQVLNVVQERRPRPGRR
jgi:hypothetical protein